MAGLGRPGGGVAKAFGLVETTRRTMSLEKEIETYERELPNLVQRAGGYVLIHGDEVADIFDSYADALKVGYERFKLDPFLVKHIEVAQEVHYFTRHLAAQCPT